MAEKNTDPDAAALSQAEIDALVRAAGFTPRQRRMDYRLVGQA
ncbi:MAG: hypothetical protein Q8S17_08350 [Humidesulfovibrio sp.]|nr:hypothetical protein [Humidesulfovibrio sp.]